MAGVNNMLNIADILKQRIQEYEANPESQKIKSKEYNKKWNEGVQFFVDRINEDNVRENRPKVTFITVRMRLVALREIDDLRWFYYVCLKYSKTYQKKMVDGKPVKNSFKRCFYGATKV